MPTSPLGRYGEQNMCISVLVQLEDSPRGGTLVKADAYIFRGNRREDKIGFAGRPPMNARSNASKINSFRLIKNNKPNLRLV